MQLTLTQAKTLCRQMELSGKTISKLKLREGMQEDAVITLARKHLALAGRKKSKAETGSPKKDETPEPRVAARSP